MLKNIALVTLLAFTVILSACGGVDSEAKYPTGLDRGSTGGDNIYEKPDSIFGKDGLSILGGKANQSPDVITVNSYLWRASLDTVSFMPIASIDPFGGVILTDWYANPDNPGERYKLNIFVMGGQLRSDGVKVSMFKQRNGKDVAVSEADNRAIEDAILNRARELRVSKALDGEK